MQNSNFEECICFLLKYHSDVLFRPYVCPTEDVKTICVHVYLYILMTKNAL